MTMMVLVVIHSGLVCFRWSCGNVSCRAPQIAYVICTCTLQVLTSLELTLLSWPAAFTPLATPAGYSANK